MVGESHDHLIVLRGKRKRLVVVPEDSKRVDGMWWEFIGEQGRGGGR